MTAVLVNPDNYPNSDDFISIMDAESIERIRKCGWEVKRTVFLEILYCAISGVGAGIARDYQNKVFYKIFYATDGVISGLTDSELRVVVEHEQDEITSATMCTEGTAAKAFVSLEEEEKRHKRTFEAVEGRHGKDTVRNALQKVHEIATIKPCIPRYVLLFWLNCFLLNNFEKFRTYSLKMSATMLSKEQRDNFAEILNKTINEYRSNPPTQQWVRLLGACQTV